MEAIIADVDISKASELGVNWATWEQNNGQTIPGATFLTPVGGAEPGGSRQCGHQPDRHQFTLERVPPSPSARSPRAASALRPCCAPCAATRHTNVIATPSVLTTDHQEATMKSADEVPFVTGQYTNTGTSGGS